MARGDFYLVNSRYSGGHVHSNPYDNGNVTYCKNGMRVRQITDRQYGSKIKVKVQGYSTEGYITIGDLERDPDQTVK